MKHTNPVAAKIAAQIEEINLAKEEVNLAIKDANGAVKVMYEIYDRIVDLKAFANKGGHKKMQDLITSLDKAHSALNRHLGE
jgi:hypothetical protein